MRLFTGGVQCFKVRSQATDGFNYQVPGPPPPDVLSVILSADDMGAALAGTWAGDWPNPEVQMRAGATTVVGPFTDPLNSLFLAFATNNAAGDLVAVIERIRIRAFQRI